RAIVDQLAHRLEALTAHHVPRVLALAAGVEAAVLKTEAFVEWFFELLLAVLRENPSCRRSEGLLGVAAAEPSTCHPVAVHLVLDTSDGEFSDISVCVETVV
ncbi:unnamed protein product, partial [Scytosiphon promiscuus]